MLNKNFTFPLKNIKKYAKIPINKFTKGVINHEKTTNFSITNTISPTILSQLQSCT